MIKVTNKLSKQGADIRYNVFIIEQGFNVEIDELDQSCFHVVYYLNDIAVAACRFYKEDELGTYHLGRFAVSKEYRNNPDNEPLLEGYDKDANILRRNMELVMGDDASEIDRSNSRAHHIVGDNEYSSESKAILEKYGIDINSPENGIFLPQNDSSDLHGTIHEGKHTKAYNDEVTQRLRSATCKEDVLEILDSIKEDLYNGDMELYHEHKFNN